MCCAIKRLAEAELDVRGRHIVVGHNFWAVRSMWAPPAGFPPPPPIAPALGFAYPMPPTLHYKYPPPTARTLRNISRGKRWQRSLGTVFAEVLPHAALAAVPKLYTQVLHLMNKMNLPPPFEGDFPEVPVPNSEGESEVGSDAEEAGAAAVVPSRQPVAVQSSADAPVKREPEQVSSGDDSGGEAVAAPGAVAVAGKSKRPRKRRRRKQVPAASTHENEPQQE